MASSLLQTIRVQEPIPYLHEPEEDEDEERDEKLQRLLARIPTDLALPIALCALQGASQDQVGGLLGITQPSVSERLGKAKARLVLMASLPDLTGEEVLTLLMARGVRPNHAQIVSTYWTEHDSYAVARLLNVPQQTVWTALFLCRWRANPGVQHIVEGVDAIRRFQGRGHGRRRGR